MISIVQNLAYLKAKANCGCFYCKFKSKTGKKFPKRSPNNPHSRSGRALACMIGSPNYPEASGGLLSLRSLSHHTSRWPGSTELRCSAEGQGVFVNMWPCFRNVTADPCIVSHCTHLKGQDLCKPVPFAEPNPRPGADTCSVLIPHNSPHSEEEGDLWNICFWGLGQPIHRL